MTVAAIYDIHGNLPALEAVLNEIRSLKVEQIVVGGDVVPGPMPAKSIELLSSLDVPVGLIRGNGDREVLARMDDVTTDWYQNARNEWREPVRWSASQLNAAHREFLLRLQDTLSLEIPGLGRVLFCHATPRSDDEIFTRETSEENLLPLFSHLDVALVVCGHTHMQFERTVGNTRVANAGSVGRPFGTSGAFWLLLGKDVQLRRTEYDYGSAAQRIMRTKYPNAEIFAQGIENPTSESVMLSAYKPVELQP